MKKVYLIGALSGLLLASCANDDLVVKPDTPAAGDNAPISFRSSLGNMSRSTNLEDVMKNFGVWAIKGDADADLKSIDLANSQLVVIPNYIVNYGTAENYGSNWSYVSTTPAQYLKYWDGSKTSTYFFAYGPHNSKRAADAPAATPNIYDVNLSVSNDATPVAKLQFPKYTLTSDEDYNYIYADAKVENNAAHITGSESNTTLAPTPVSLSFHRLLSQVKIAFYEDIPGYKVQMKGVTFADGTSCGVAALPADFDETKVPAWSRGSYINSVIPTVTFTGTSYATKDVTYTSAVRPETGANLEFALPSTNLTDSKYISNAQAKPSASATVYNVIPTTSTAAKPLKITSDAAWSASATAIEPNSGLQFVVNYDLVSEDTKEVISVKGARVYVDPTWTAYELNKVYTYIFRITVNSSGTTTTVDPVNDPVEPTPCLYPIIFKGVVIDDVETGSNEWDITDLVMSQTTATLAPSATLALTVTDPALPEGITLTSCSSSNTAVATASKDATDQYKVNVTAVAPGKTTISAVYGTKIATCEITVTNGVDILTPGPVAMTVGDDDVELDFVSDGAVTWTSGDDDVATVTDGKIHAVGAGTATITATLTADPTKTATITVNVTAAP